MNELEQQIQAWHQAQGASRQLAEIPGIGPLTASALVASIGDARALRTDGNWRRGWDWCHASIRAAASRSY